MEAQISEYKGHKILMLPMGEKGKPFSFGLRKARIILEYLDDIKAFVAAGESRAATPEKEEKHEF